MNPSEARRAIEDLRIGLPPDGYVKYFTVGRKSEIDQLKSRLSQQQKGPLLLKANPGSGKSHLLRFLHEVALEKGYSVSSVTLDAKSAIRFNRMDQILGAIWRGIELPNVNKQRGIRPFLDAICKTIEASKKVGREDFWYNLTNNWQWDFSRCLESPSIFIAIRAWATGLDQIHDLIEDWLFQPWLYYAQRRLLYTRLIEQLRKYFRDPRPEWKFYNEGIFDFRAQGYTQSWAALRDIHKLSLEAGLKGLIILFDEFEDIITNMRNIKHQEGAFWNLFEFYNGNEFKGMTYFAVTPDFVNKCKLRLLQKGIWDYDYTMFDKLPTFEMSPLQVEELQELALKILQVHGVAYNWDPDLLMKMSDLRGIVKRAASIQIQDRARHTIREIVKYLDRLIEDII